MLNRFKELSLEELKDELEYYKIGCDKKNCIEPNFCSTCTYKIKFIEKEIELKYK